MKITSAHLEALRLLLLEETAALATESTTAKAATDAREKRSAAVRSLTGAFDIAAAAFATDADLSANQLNDLPHAAQQALGYAPPVPAPKA